MWGGISRGVTHHGDDDLGLLGVGNEVHGSAHTLDLTGKHEVGEIWIKGLVNIVHYEFVVKGAELTSVLADLESTKHGQVNAARADHTETLVGTENRSTATQGDGLLAGVDQVGVLLTGLGVATQTQDTVLGLEDDLNTLLDVGGSNQGHSDTKVDVHAVLEFLGGTLDDTFTTDSGLTGTYNTDTC